jgi:hypothetical protein
MRRRARNAWRGCTLGLRGPGWVLTLLPRGLRLALALAKAGVEVIFAVIFTAECNDKSPG